MRQTYLKSHKAVAARCWKSGETGIVQEGRGYGAGSVCRRNKNANLQGLAFCVDTVLGGPGRNRTTDTRIFNPLLYQLSYQAKEQNYSRLKRNCKDEFLSRTNAIMTG